MGGKTKHTQRSKNNTKPSSSSRSAELLGTAATAFVGFSAHSDYGFIPFAPGFSTVEQVPESQDGSISPKFQLIIRKLSKKDPMTKKKGLQEFNELIRASDMEEIKAILPLWPKYYATLACDIEHIVRELAQMTLQILVSKCNRAIAPYLKQIVPVWLVSRFDIYAPAASIAQLSFNDTFMVNINRTQEVLIHCQKEILEYVTKNINHTASTLSIGKSITPEEAEQKYLRVIVSSLKTLSFFVEHTSSVVVSSQLHSSLQNLISQQKFWSFGKHKDASIKAAWFELYYHILQIPDASVVIGNTKTQLITICFQNIDEADPLVAPHLWSCILLLPLVYDDWYASLNFNKVILPKLSSLMRNGFKKNAKAICPNLLPFFSRLLSDCAQDIVCNSFYINFFDDIKSTIVTQKISKEDISVIIKSYFECMRLFLQQLNNGSVKCGEQGVDLGKQLFHDNVLELIQYFLNNDSVTAKYFFLHASALLAFLVEKQRNDATCIYKNLSDDFWKYISNIILKNLDNKKDSEPFLECTLKLIYNLHSANANLEIQRVKYVEQENESSNSAINLADTKDSFANSTDFKQNELKDLVLHLVRFCLDNANILKSSKHLQYVRQLTKLYSDPDFYKSITDDKSLRSTLDYLARLISVIDDDECEIILDIIFEILQYQDNTERFQYIKTCLLRTYPKHLQTFVLLRLLSYPLCLESEVRAILSEEAASTAIVNMAHDVIQEHKKNKLMVLQKCFFQTHTGDILIGRPTVDRIINIISEALDNNYLHEIVDDCARFIAQIMPVVCSNENSSKEVQHEVFLKLFKFSLERSSTEYLSEDTIWEIATSWQDALACGDIVIDAPLLQACATIVERHLQAEDLTSEDIDTMAETLNKFVICSAECLILEDTWLTKIEEVIIALLYSNIIGPQGICVIEEYCLFLEMIKGYIFTGIVELPDDIAMRSVQFKLILKRALLNFSTIQKFIDATHKGQNPHDSFNDAPKDNLTKGHYEHKPRSIKTWSEALFAEILKCINIAAIAGSLCNTSDEFNYTTSTLAQELLKKVKIFMKSTSKMEELKNHMLEEAAKEKSNEFCRSLVFLRHCEHYAQFEENSTILLAENLSEYLISQKALRAYVTSLQYLLPELEPRAMSLQSAIMRTEPTDVWVKASVFRCLIVNNFSANFNENLDKNIAMSTIEFISKISDIQHNRKEFLLYNVEIHKQQFANVINTVTYVDLLTEVIRKFPHQLTIKNWDNIRIGLSSWVLSISKSIENYTNSKVALFIVSVYKLFGALMQFFIEEKPRSSTVLLMNVVDEWDTLFSREVNLVLFRSFYDLCNSYDINELHKMNGYSLMMKEISEVMECVDYSVVYTFCKNSTKISLDNLCNFVLKHLSNPIHSIRVVCMRIIKKITQLFVAEDIEIFEKQSESLQSPEQQLAKWHFLNRFEDYIARYEFPIRKYLDEFSFKLSELNELEPIDRNLALNYLLLWDCIIYACAKSPVTLRAVYTHWLHENKYEQNFLHFLFRAMPLDILKNHDSKIMNNDIFRGLTWSQIKEQDRLLEKYACHLYTETLRKLPALARRWWNTSPSRQKTFVDKLTTNFVSPLICTEELKSIINKKEKHENMQVTVHTSTREVLAVYSIDEVRMELVITLAQNYPLGAVKVECGKQIGGRSSSRNVGMQLTIFLTHQNGTIFDGLTLWKNNLDKKFEGVEECYICYTVIHQDTCQLPKLTCKTCKKKFHGPCLYKWFTTSSKSTCPICRNVF